MTLTNEQIQALQHQCRVLRAMSLTYTLGRTWTLYETVVVTKAADGIESLLAGREADKLLIAELQGIRAAAEKLVRCKGRFHSEQNYRALAALFGVNTPDLPPLDSEARTLTLPPKIERNDIDGWWMYQGRRVGGGCAEWYNKAIDDVAAMNEARTLTVKLPDDGLEDCMELWGDKAKDTFDCGYNFSAYRHEEVIREACAAAGITLVVGGE